MGRRINIIVRITFGILGVCLLVSGCNTRSLLNSIEEDVRAATAAKEYTLTILAEPDFGGTTIPAGQVTAEKDKPINIQAIPDVCADWVEWTVTSGAGVGFGDSTSASTTVKLTQEDAVIVANFDPVYFDLTVQGENGSVTPAGTQSVLRGKSTDITCNPNTNYYFVNWTASPSGNATFGSASSASTTVILTGDATVTAVCTNVLVNMTVSHTPPAGGTTNPSGTVSVSQGSVQNISATPNAGYSFSGWSTVSGTGVSFGDSNSADTTVTLSSGSAEISAAFVVTPEVLSASPASGSTIASDQTITLTFSKNMNSGTLSVSGTLVTPGYTTSWPNASTPPTWIMLMT